MQRFLIPRAGYSSIQTSWTARRVTFVGLLIVGISTALTLPQPSHARDREVATDRFTEYATVVSTTPVYKEVRVRQPRQECWFEQRREIVGYERIHTQRYNDRHHYHGNGDALVGGIVGGVIGNQLGRGKHSSTRAGATIAGAIIGGTLANKARGDSYRPHKSQRIIERRPIYETREVKQCKTVPQSRLESRLQHYDVTYRYRGQLYTTRMQRDPGPRLELQVTVRPARQ